MPPAAAPQRFGRYELLKRLGAGGMGEVWLARLPGVGGADKLCVVKKILPHLSEDEQFVTRFLDEAKVLIHLAHGNISHVFEMGQEDEQYFMAMEYVEGRPLSRLIQRVRQSGRAFPLELALYIGIRLCDALAYAHARRDAAGRPLNVVHRDVSPANVLVSFSGEVKIIDFGAALSTMKEAETAPRVVIGNLSYMSPEQAQKRPVDSRADVYSASVLLWELTSWHQIQTTGDHVERWRRAAYPRFQPPSMYRPSVPAELDRVIMKGLAPKVENRLQSAEELRDELQRCLAQLAPGTSQSSLGAFVSDLFAEEAASERAFVAEALDRGPPTLVDVLPAFGPGEITSPDALASARRGGHGDDDRARTAVDLPRIDPTMLLDDEIHTETVRTRPRTSRGTVALAVGLFLLAFAVGALAVVAIAGQGSMSNEEAAQLDP